LRVRNRIWYFAPKYPKGKPVYVPPMSAMNPYGFLTVALAAESQHPPIVLTQDPAFDLLVVALTLALVLILVGYTHVERSPVGKQSSTIPTWIQVIGLIVILLILFVIKYIE